MESQERVEVPISTNVGLQQGYKQNSKILNDIFCRLTVSGAKCILGRGEHADAGSMINYDNDDISQRYGQIKEAFRALTIHDNLQL